MPRCEPQAAASSSRPCRPSLRHFPFHRPSHPPPPISKFCKLVPVIVLSTNRNSGRCVRFYSFVQSDWKLSRHWRNRAPNYQFDVETIILGCFSCHPAENETFFRALNQTKDSYLKTTKKAIIMCGFFEDTHVCYHLELINEHSQVTLMPQDRSPRLFYVASFGKRKERVGGGRATDGVCFSNVIIFFIRTGSITFSNENTNLYIHSKCSMFHIIACNGYLRIPKCM